jgi:hypothetical protein
MLMRWKLFIALVSLGLLVPLATYAEPTSYKLTILKETQAIVQVDWPMDIPEAVFLTDESEIVGLKASQVHDGTLNIVTPNKTISFFIGKYANHAPFAWNTRGDVFLVRDGGIVSLDASGAPTKIVGKEDVIDGKTVAGIAGPIATNSQGQLAFNAGGAGLCTLAKCVATVGSKIEDLEIISFSKVFLTDNGEIVFSAIVSGYVEAIFKDDRVLVKDGDVIGGKSIRSVSLLSVSKQGHVVFSANIDEKTNGLFTLDGLVAKSDDLINGRPYNMWISPVVNSKGDVAFIGMGTASSEINSYAVVLASPTVAVASTAGQTSAAAPVKSSFKLIPILIFVGIGCVIVFLWPKSGARK